MTTQAPVDSIPGDQIIDIGSEIIRRTGLSREDLAKLPRTESFFDLTKTVWSVDKPVPIREAAGYTVIHIADSGEDDDVRVYGAPIPRPNMSEAELKALHKKGGTFGVWVLRRDVQTMLCKVIRDPDSFAEMVAKEIRRLFDDFVENDDEIDDAIEYLEELQKKGGTLAQAIEGLKAGAHQEEDEEEAPSAAPNPS